MTIAGLGTPRISDGTTADKGFLRTDGATAGGADRRGLSAGTIGLLAAGGIGLAGGIAMRAAGLGRIGTGIAALGGAILGASLLTACGSTGGSGPSRRTDVPGDEGGVGDGVEIVGESWADLPPAGTDTTNPAPEDWYPDSGTRDAREGVVQIVHGRGMGSGWVVEPGLLVTNYHVAQGFADVDVIDHRGTTHDGTVLRLDREHDLALVSAPTLRDTPLAMDDTVDELEGAETTGYPGGEFNNDAAHAAAMIDVLDAGRRREAILLLGTSQPGVSGGAVINGAGEVVGTSFAVGELGDGDDPSNIVLAIPNDQVREFLDSHARAERDESAAGRTPGA